MLKRKTIQTKFLMAFFIIIMLNTLVSLYYRNRVHRMMNFNQAAQESYYHINSISEEIKVLNQYMQLYMQKPEDSVRSQYNDARENLNKKLSALSGRRDLPAEWYMIHAIQNSVESMCIEYDEALQSLEARGQEAYVTYYRGQKISKYIPGYINEYLNILLTENAKEAQVLTEKTNRADRLTKSLLIGSAMMGVLLSSFITGIITRPLRQLSHAAKEISNGNFGIEDVPVIYEDEIGTLTRIFNRMKDDIREAIETMSQREMLEAKLYEEELKNIKMNELLKEAQYLALQSQINPHFLFNTLNVISRAVVHEEPKTTTTLIRNLADLFRYNLSHLNNFSTLEEELAIVEKYIYIQKHRFRDRVRYQVSERSGCNDALIPSMILQPLVENSIIHGIEGLEFGGAIRVDVVLRGAMLCIRVWDNGVGIGREIQQMIRSGGIKNHTGHTTAIGLSNIIKRIELIPYGKVSILSSGRRGTIIQIRIPLNRGEGYHV